MVKELAEAMSGKGWDVTVAAGYPHHPQGRLYPGYAQKWVEVEQHEGFQVVRGWHLINPSPALTPRPGDGLPMRHFFPRDLEKPAS